MTPGPWDRDTIGQRDIACCKFWLDSFELPIMKLSYEVRASSGLKMYQFSQLLKTRRPHKIWLICRVLATPDYLGMNERFYGQGDDNSNELHTLLTGDYVVGRSNSLLCHCVCSLRYGATCRWEVVVNAHEGEYNVNKRWKCAGYNDCKKN